MAGVVDLSGLLVFTGTQTRFTSKSGFKLQCACFISQIQSTPKTYWAVLDTKRNRLRFFFDESKTRLCYWVDLKTIVEIIKDDETDFGVRLIGHDTNYRIRAFSQRDVQRWSEVLTRLIDYVPPLIAQQYHTSRSKENLASEANESDDIIFDYSKVYENRKEFCICFIAQVSVSSRDSRGIKGRNFSVVVSSISYETTDHRAQVNRMQGGNLVRIGDVVVGVNGLDITSLAFNEAMIAIRRAGWPKKLYFLRPKEPSEPFVINSFNPIMSICGGSLSSNANDIAKAEWVRLKIPGTNKLRLQYMQLSLDQMCVRCSLSSQELPCCDNDASFSFSVHQISRLQPVCDRNAIRTQQHYIQFLFKPETTVCWGSPSSTNKELLPMETLDVYVCSDGDREQWVHKITQARMDCRHRTDASSVSCEIEVERINGRGGREEVDILRTSEFVDRDHASFVAPLVTIDICNDIDITLLGIRYGKTPGPGQGPGHFMTCAVSLKNGYLQWKAHKDENSVELEDNLVKQQTSVSSNIHRGDFDRGSRGLAQGGSGWYSKLIASEAACNLINLEVQQNSSLPAATRAGKSSIKCLHKRDLYRFQLSFSFTKERDTLVLGLPSRAALKRWIAVVTRLLSHYPAHSPKPLLIAHSCDLLNEVCRPPGIAKQVRQSPSSFRFLNDEKEGKNGAAIAATHTGPGTGPGTGTASITSMTSSMTTSTKPGVLEVGIRSPEGPSWAYHSSVNEVIQAQGYLYQVMADRPGCEGWKCVYIKRWCVLAENSLYYYRRMEDCGDWRAGSNSATVPFVRCEGENGAQGDIVPNIDDGRVNDHEGVDDDESDGDNYEEDDDFDSYGSEAGGDDISAEKILNRHDMLSGTGCIDMCRVAECRDGTDENFGSDNLIILCIRTAAEARAREGTSIGTRKEEGEEEREGTEAEASHGVRSQISGNAEVLLLAADDDEHVRWMDALEECVRSIQTPSSCAPTLIGSHRLAPCLSVSTALSNELGSEAVAAAVAVVLEGQLSMYVVDRVTAQWSWATRRFVLTRGTLSCYDQPQSRNDSHQRKLVEISTIAIIQVKSASLDLSDPDDDDDDDGSSCDKDYARHSPEKYGFVIRAHVRKKGNSEGVRTFSLAAPTAEICLQWMLQLCASSGQLVLRFISPIAGYISELSKRANILRDSIRKRSHKSFVVLKSPEKVVPPSSLQNLHDLEPTSTICSTHQSSKIQDSNIVACEKTVSMSRAEAKQSRSRAVLEPREEREAEAKGDEKMASRNETKRQSKHPQSDFAPKKLFLDDSDYSDDSDTGQDSTGRLCTIRSSAKLAYPSSSSLQLPSATSAASPSSSAAAASSSVHHSRSSSKGVDSYTAVRMAGSSVLRSGRGRGFSRLGPHSLSNGRERTGVSGDTELTVTAYGTGSVTAANGFKSTAGTVVDATYSQPRRQIRFDDEEEGGGDSDSSGQPIARNDGFAVDRGKRSHETTHDASSLQDLFAHKCMSYDGAEWKYETNLAQSPRLSRNRSAAAQHRSSLSTGNLPPLPISVMALSVLEAAVAADARAGVPQQPLRQLLPPPPPPLTFQDVAAGTIDSTRSTPSVFRDVDSPTACSSEIASEIVSENASEIASLSKPRAPTAVRPFIPTPTTTAVIADTAVPTINDITRLAGECHVDAVLTPTLIERRVRVHFLDESLNSSKSVTQHQNPSQSRSVNTSSTQITLGDVGSVDWAETSFQDVLSPIDQHEEVGVREEKRREGPGELVSLGPIVVDKEAVNGTPSPWNVIETMELTMETMEPLMMPSVEQVMTSPPPLSITLGGNELNDLDGHEVDELNFVPSDSSCLPANSSSFSSSSSSSSSSFSPTAPSSSSPSSSSAPPEVRTLPPPSSIYFAQLRSIAKALGYEVTPESTPTKAALGYEVTPESTPTKAALGYEVTPESTPTKAALGDEWVELTSETCSGASYAIPETVESKFAAVKPSLQPDQHYPQSNILNHEFSAEKPAKGLTDTSLVVSTPVRSGSKLPRPTPTLQRHPSAESMPLSVSTPTRTLRHGSRAASGLQLTAEAVPAIHPETFRTVREGKSPVKASQNSGSPEKIGVERSSKIPMKSGSAEQSTAGSFSTSFLSSFSSSTTPASSSPSSANRLVKPKAISSSNKHPQSNSPSKAPADNSSSGFTPSLPSSPSPSSPALSVASRISKFSARVSSSQRAPMDTAVGAGARSKKTGDNLSSDENARPSRRRSASGEIPPVLQRFALESEKVKRERALAQQDRATKKGQVQPSVAAASMGVRAAAVPATEARPIKEPATTVPPKTHVIPKGPKPVPVCTPFPSTLPQARTFTSRPLVKKPNSTTATKIDTTTTTATTTATTTTVAETEAVSRVTGGSTVAMESLEHVDTVENSSALIETKAVVNAAAVLACPIPVASAATSTAATVIATADIAATAATAASASDAALAVDAATIAPATSAPARATVNDHSSSESLTGLIRWQNRAKPSVVSDTSSLHVLPSTSATSVRSDDAMPTDEPTERRSRNLLPKSVLQKFNPNGERDRANASLIPNDESRTRASSEPFKPELLELLRYDARNSQLAQKHKSLTVKRLMYTGAASSSSTNHSSSLRDSSGSEWVGQSHGCGRDRAASASPEPVEGFADLEF